MDIKVESILHGIFVKEIKNRFRCLVNVDGEELICYVASSSRLSNYIEIRGCEVLLIPNHGNATEYTLFAAIKANKLILLELSAANAIIAEQLSRRYFSFLGKRKNVFREKAIGGYKADIYIADSNTIIEVKTVLSESKTALFPVTYSERSLSQLEKIANLLQQGYKVCYLFVCLNPGTKRICFDSSTPFFTAFSRCIDTGMLCKGCKINYKSGKLEISTMVNIDSSKAQISF